MQNDLTQRTDKHNGAEWIVRHEVPTPVRQMNPLTGKRMSRKDAAWFGQLGARLRHVTHPGFQARQERRATEQRLKHMAKVDPRGFAALCAQMGWTP